MDIVYPVRPGDNNEELRFSLRSLQNIPHDTVWIVGYCPTWVKNVRYIPREQRRLKYYETTQNLLAACKHPEVSDDFIYFNDDFYVMTPIDKLETYHRGTLVQHIATHKRLHRMGNYYAGLVETHSMLQYFGIRDPLSYELHVPMVVNKTNWQIAHAEAAKIRRPGIMCYIRRSFYGNYFQIGGEEISDVKVFKTDAEMKEGNFLSSYDPLIRIKSSTVYKHLKKAFPKPSPYESRGKVRLR